MNLNDFIKKYDGKQVEYHSYGNTAYYQCVDLVNQYIVEVLKLTPIIGTDAKDFLNKAKTSEFEVIKKTPTGVPNKGDIIVWGHPAGGGAGHVGVFLEGNANSFKSFDQNWSTVQRCKIEGHYYTNVIGWLRPKVQNSTPDMNLENLLKKKLSNEAWNMLKEFEHLRQLKLINRDDSIQSQVQKWIESHTKQDTKIKELERQLQAKDSNLTGTIEQKKHFEERVKELEEELFLKTSSHKEIVDTYKERIIALEAEIEKYDVQEGTNTANTGTTNSTCEEEKKLSGSINFLIEYVKKIFIK